MFLWEMPPLRSHATEIELPFAVDIWSESKSTIEARIATFGDLTLARECFHTCKARYPGKVLTLRHGMQVILSNEYEMKR
jgi:hypothetical protein